MQQRKSWTDDDEDADDDAYDNDNDNNDDDYNNMVYSWSATIVMIVMSKWLWPTHLIKVGLCHLIKVVRPGGSAREYS